MGGVPSVKTGPGQQEKTTMDRIAPLHELKKIFRADKVNGDNVVFRLHHEGNFFVVLLGITFIFGENYLNGKAIICQNGNAYINQYCWLHGSGHLGSSLSQQVSGCIADQNVFTKSGDKRHTSYYLWLPFILGICLAIIKTPRFFWKHFCERGLMESMVQLDNDSEKLNSKFRKIRSPVSDVLHQLRVLRDPEHPERGGVHGQPERSAGRPVHDLRTRRAGVLRQQRGGQEVPEDGQPDVQRVPHRVSCDVA